MTMRVRLSTSSDSNTVTIGQNLNFININLSERKESSGVVVADSLKTGRAMAFQSAGSKCLGVVISPGRLESCSVL